MKLLTVRLGYDLTKSQNQQHQVCGRYYNFFNITGLQTLMDQKIDHSHQFGLNINVDKTRQMVISKNIITGGYLYVNQIRIERVKQYCYLGTVVNKRWDDTWQIKCHILTNEARTTFIKMSAIFKHHSLSFETKMRYIYKIVRVLCAAI